MSSDNGMHIVNDIIVNDSISDMVQLKDNGDSFDVVLWGDIVVRIDKDAPYSPVHSVAGDVNAEALKALVDSVLSWEMNIYGLGIKQSVRASHDNFVKILESVDSEYEKYGYGADSVDGFFDYNYADTDQSVYLALSGDEDITRLEMKGLKNGHTLIFNGMRISDEVGPTELSKVFGKPSVVLEVPRIKDYAKNHECAVTYLTLSWSHEDCPVSIDLVYELCDVCRYFKVRFSW